MKDLPRAVQTFIELVKIPSPSFREKDFCFHLKKILEELGLEVFIDDAGEKIGGNCGNLIAILPSNEPSYPPLLFNSHLDTVEPCDDIKPVIEGDLIKSDGKTILGADDKVGIAAIIEALKRVIENNLNHGRLELVFTVGEEKGLLGAKNLDLSIFQAQAGFVLDSEGEVGKVVIKAPSQDYFKATFKGKAAHAGVCPESGVNSIQIASRAISKMKLGRIDYETTANIGLIKGGLAINIVPEETVIEGEARSHNERKLTCQIEKMRREAEKEAKKMGGEVKVEVTRLYNSFHLDKKSLPLRIASKALKLLGVKPIYFSTGGGSDTNIFNQKNIPCLSLGVGASNVHTTAETTTISSLEKLTALILKIIEVSKDFKDG